MKKIILQIIIIVLTAASLLPVSCGKDEAPVTLAKSVSIDKFSISLHAGTTEQLTATVLPVSATDKRIVWKSSADSVATVDQNGLVTGVADGTAMISVVVVNGGYTTSCVTKVRAVPVTGVSLDRDTLRVTQGATPLQLTAIIAPADATFPEVTWSSDNADVATVSDGTVSFHTYGVATVTATTDDGGYTANCAITVEITEGDVAGTGWTYPDGEDYEYSMTYVTQIAFQGLLSLSEDAEFAAFVDDECRGYAKLIHDAYLNTYLVHLTIYSNRSSGESIVFKAYNPVKKRIYSNCGGLGFQSNSTQGSASGVLNCLP
jgi:hypothetical protein